MARLPYFVAALFPSGVASGIEVKQTSTVKYMRVVTLSLLPEH